MPTGGQYQDAEQLCFRTQGSSILLDRRCYALRIQHGLILTGYRAV
jgi:hypothetical protein